MRETVQVFAEEMEKKLAENDRLKGGWEDLPYSYLKDRLLEEQVEMEEALGLYLCHMDEPSATELLRECCDIGAFAMMIFSKVHPMTKHNKRGRAVRAIPRYPAKKTQAKGSVRLGQDDVLHMAMLSGVSRVANIAGRLNLGCGPLVEAASNVEFFAGSAMDTYCQIYLIQEGDWMKIMEEAFVMAQAAAGSPRASGVVRQNLEVLKEGMVKIHPSYDPMRAAFNKTLDAVVGLVAAIKQMEVTS